MRAQADFIDGHIMFSPIERPSPDMRRLQGAMFMDRPDLWPVNGRRRSKSVPTEQQPLFDREDTPG